MLIRSKKNKNKGLSLREWKVDEGGQCEGCPVSKDWHANAGAAAETRPQKNRPDGRVF